MSPIEFMDAGSLPGFHPERPKPKPITRPDIPEARFERVREVFRLLSEDVVARSEGPIEDKENGRFAAVTISVIKGREKAPAINQAHTIREELKDDIDRVVKFDESVAYSPWADKVFIYKTCTDGENPNRAYLVVSVFKKTEGQ